MVQGIIFDLDGTLLDSMELWAHLGEHYLQSLGITPRASLPHRLQAMSLEEAIHYFQDTYDVHLSEAQIWAGIDGLIEHAYVEELQLKPGVRQFLERLYLLEIPMVIATANDRELVEAVLRRCQVYGFFDGILTCDEVGASKRQPKIYRQALRLLGTRRSQTLVFEDASHAAETAKAAGFPVVGVYDPHERDPVHLREISDYYLTSFLDTSCLPIP